MGDLGIIPDGAVLIHNGTVRETGPSRRVENLAVARTARVIDAGGRIVMPAFVDPDAVLVHPPPLFRPGPNSRCSMPAEASLRAVSTRVLCGRAALVAADIARYGILSVGAHTGHALDLRAALKILRVHRSLQMKPLRVRSLLALRIPPESGRTREELLRQIIDKWLPAVRTRKLASIVEFGLDEDSSVLGFEGSLAAARAASSLGFSVRFRAGQAVDRRALELARDAGALALVGAGSHREDAAASACIQVFPIGVPDPAMDASTIRRMLDAGYPVAIGSGYRPTGYASLNPQFLLHSATARFAMTSEEAITAATWNAACSLRMSHVAGSIEPEKPADLLVLDVPDYLELPRRTGQNDVLTCVRAGTVVYRRAAVAGEAR